MTSPTPLPNVWILLNTWTYDGLEILGVFSSEPGAYAARDKLPRADRVNSEIRGPFQLGAQA